VIGAVVFSLLSILVFNYIDQDQLARAIFEYYPILLTVFFGTLIVCFIGFYNYYHEKTKTLKTTSESLQSEIEQLKIQRNSYKDRCENLQEQYADLEIASSMRQLNKVI
jgi:FtsZ-binding cell division protein ZapB